MKKPCPIRKSKLICKSDISMNFYLLFKNTLGHLSIQNIGFMYVTFILNL